MIIPASNEAAWIGRCLSALAASDPAPHGPVQVIVVANGCTDDTAARAKAAAGAIRARGWSFMVLERTEGGKPAALDAGDGAAAHGNRLYLDADVTVSAALLAQVAAALDPGTARFVGATPRISPARSAVTRAYARFWAQVPFNRSAAPGYGLFALTAAGRARWGDWPRIISDDTFARLQFAPAERVQVPAAYDWPLPEGLGPLIRVRARQNRGVAQIARLFPALMAQEAKPRAALAPMILRAPFGFMVYALVALAVRLGAGGGGGWARGR
ncbi:MAG: glycosyltransferase [Rhodobacteraceae bacterium]|nr:glycosyltransferase [Paracoccaceae bacterium]